MSVEGLPVVSWMLPEHAPRCPAWDSWPCNCGARQIPLVTLGAALAAVAAAERRLPGMAPAPHRQLGFQVVDKDQARGLDWGENEA